MHTAMVSKFDRNTRRLAVRGKEVTATSSPIVERVLTDIFPQGPDLLLWKQAELAKVGRSRGAGYNNLKKERLDMQGFVEWLGNTPIITNGLIMFLCVYVVIMAIYSLMYVAFGSNRNSMTNPLAVVFFGVFVGGPAIFFLLGLLYCSSVLL